MVLFSPPSKESKLEVPHTGLVFPWVSGVEPLFDKGPPWRLSDARGHLHLKDEWLMPKSAFLQGAGRRVQGSDFVGREQNIS